MSNLAIIPARSGSKGLPDKNIKLLCGKPLLAYSVEAALKSGMFDTVHVSTDSEEYARIAKECGADVPFLRSEETASDTASSVSVILEVLERYAVQGKSFQTVMLLQPTSPLRTAKDIKKAYQTYVEKDAASVISVCEAEHSPLWCNTLPENNCMDGFIPANGHGPRQKLQKFYRLNGALYLLSVEKLQETHRIGYDKGTYAYCMSAERSVDIDSELDFMIAETIMRATRQPEDD